MDWSALRSQLMSDLDDRPAPPAIELPPLPHVVSQFCELAENPEVEIPELVTVLEQDSGVTVEILKYCNSSHHGLRTRVESVKRALAVLGINSIKFLLLRSSLHKIAQSAPSGLINVPLFLQESWERALFSKSLAEHLSLDTDVALTGSILQDFLLPFLCHHRPEIYHQYLKDQLETQVDLSTYEREALGWTHAELAAHFMEKWRFPDALICAVMLHHQWDRIIEEEELSQSPCVTIAAAALLPDELNQEVDGLSRLLKWEEQGESVQVLELLQDLEEQLPDYLPSGDGEACQSSLLKRCNDLLLNSVCPGRSTSVLQEGSVVGNYTVVRPLKQGGMGVVYHAKHTTMNRPAAIKLLDPEQLTGRTIDSFEREVLMTSQLMHPNTVTIFDYGRLSSGLFYYAMEFVDGMSLKELVTRSGPLPDARCVQILRQVCASLAEAHAAGMVHRDIKPENIMISYRGVFGDYVKVLDFGLVSSVDQPESSGDQQICGTPQYMSPEAIMSPEKVDSRSDLYSVGALAYYLLTGREVFEADTVQELLGMHVYKKPHGFAQVIDHAYSAELESVIMTCLEKTREARLQTAEALIEQLDGCECATPWTNAMAKAWWEQSQDEATTAEAEIETSDTLCGTMVSMPRL